jgi:CRP-like cAMP-binding protein
MHLMTSVLFARNLLLDGLPSEDLALLDPHLKHLSLPQGQVLHEQGARVEHVYFPHSGMISLLTVMQQGDAVETATVGREGVIGAMTGLGTRHASTTAIVQVPATASRIAVSRFHNAAGRSERIREMVARYNEALLVQVQQTAACHALHDVEARMSRWLLQTQDRTEAEVIPLTQEFLSQMLGVRRTTVTLVARALQAAGLIRYHRGQIMILDRKGLEETACECYDAVRRQFDRGLPRSRA